MWFSPLGIPAGGRIHDPGSRKTLTGPGRGWENSGTTEPLAVPVVPLFPLPKKREGIIRKNKGTGPGKQRGLSTGTGEVIFSRIWRVKVRAGCVGARP